MKSLKGKMFLAGLMAEMFKQMKKASSGDNNLSEMAAGEGAKQMMAGFSILRMASMVGMMNIEITKEQLLDWNAKLNKIKKVD